MRKYLGMVLLAACISTGVAQAQDPTQARLIVSQNLVMLKTDDVRPIQQLRPIKTDENRVVVPAGQFLLAWPTQAISGHMLAITENGMVGYIAINQDVGSWYLEEERLREFKGRIDEGKAVAAVIVIKQTRIQPTPTSYAGDVTWGEFYVAVKANAWEYVLELSADKKAQIARYLKDTKQTIGVPDTVTVPAEAVEKIDFGRVLPDGVTFDLKSNQLLRASEKKAIAAVWPRIVAAGYIHKKCGTAQEVTVSGSAGAGGEIAVGLDASGLTKLISKLGFSAELHGKVDKSWKRVEEVPATTEIRTTLYRHSSNTVNDVIEVMLRNECDKNQRAFIFPTAIGAINMSDLFASLATTADWKEAFDPATGRITVRCYDKYVALRDKVIEKMTLESGIDFFLSRVVFLAGKSFFSPVCGKT